ncbi:MAG: extracellular solute-binding protein [Desulfobacteraceae bacterium]|jgi:multiple sugar transport system substrate-binding protein/raffinose/stachyose/melibiose transport system substrate-binding protein
MTGSQKKSNHLFIGLLKMTKKSWSALSIIIIYMVLTGWAPQKAIALEAEQIIFLHYWTGPLSGGISEMVTVFNEKHPRFHVSAAGFEHESFKIGIQVMLAGGNPPDLFSYWAGARIQSLVDKNYLSPVDDLWKEAKMDERFPTPVANACTYNGKKYAIPVTLHYAGFFYNKKIFKENELTPPKRWEEFIAVCETLKKRKIAPIALGSMERWPAQFWFDYILLRTAGPKYRHRLMTGKAFYNDPEVIQAFKIWKQVLDQGYVIKNPNVYDWAAAAKKVYHGEAAMTLMGTWIIGFFDNQLGWKQDVDYDFFPFPVIDPNVPSVSVGPIDAIVIPKKSKLGAAKKTMEYFADIDPQKEMSKGSGALAPNKNISSAFYSKLQQRILKTIGETQYWAFNYDLATPPLVAESGLDCFVGFLDHPGDYKKILSKTDKKTRQIIKER